MIPEPTEALLPCPNACFPWLPEHRLAVVGDLQDSRGGATEFVAGCRDCDLFTDQQRTREEAIAAWNTREPEAGKLREALEDARAAIASLDEFALGGVDIADTHTGDSVGQYGIRDELLAKIDTALSRNQGR
jgi:hypothetical protein